MPKATNYHQDLVEATKLIFSGQPGAGEDLLQIAKVEILADILAALERLNEILDRSPDRLTLESEDARRAPQPYSRPFGVRKTRKS